MTSRDAATESPDDVRVIRGGEETRVIDLTDEASGALAAQLSVVTPTARALRYHQIVAGVLVAIDVLCLSIALLVSHALRFGIAPDRGYLAGMVVSGILWVGVFHALGLYAPHRLSGLEEFRRTVSAVGLGVVLVILLSFWFNVYLSRSWIGLTLLTALALEISARRVVRAYERRLHRKESLVVRTLVVGSRLNTPQPMEALDMQGSAFVPIGFVDLTDPLIAPPRASVVELAETVRAILRQYRPECVLVTTPTIGKRQMVAVTQAARQEGVLVRVYTHLSGIWATRITVQDVGREGVVLTLRPAGLTRIQRAVKRGMDVTLAGIATFLAAPVLLVAAIAIKLTSPGPVLFRQERVTEGDRIFQMYKLRTMEVESEPEDIDTSVPFFKMKADPRLTTVGKWLRRLSIDELPQLFNVLVGDMSLVGPRPLPAEQVAANLELLGPRHEVRAGITGYWQIQGRADIDAEEAVRLDHFYIENWSPALDVYILLRTVGVLFTRKGAY